MRTVTKGKEFETIRLSVPAGWAWYDQVVFESRKEASTYLSTAGRIPTTKIIKRGGKSNPYHLIIVEIPDLDAAIIV
jgi:hypothetical protein